MSTTFFLYATFTIEKNKLRSDDDDAVVTARVRQERASPDPVFRRSKAPTVRRGVPLPSEHKVYILCAKKKNDDNNLFQPLFTSSLFFITDRCQNVSSTLVFIRMSGLEYLFWSKQQQTV